MPVEAKKIMPFRVMMCGGIKSGWYEATHEERQTKIYPRFKEILKSWQEKYDIRLIGTIDDDLFTVASFSSKPWDFYLLYEINNLETVTNMIESIRRHEAGKLTLDRYFRFEAIIGKPFSWLEN